MKGDSLPKVTHWPLTYVGRSSAEIRHVLYMPHINSRDVPIFLLGIYFGAGKVQPKGESVDL